MVNPCYDLKIEKKQDGAKAPADNKKVDTKKQEGGKDQKPKEQGKKKEVAKAPAPAKKPVAEEKPKEEVKKVAAFKDLRFDFYDFKTLYVNAKDKQEVLNTLYNPETHWDDEALSFWLV
jgi:hypothetical protein